MRAGGCAPGLTCNACVAEWFHGKMKTYARANPGPARCLGGRQNRTQITCGHSTMDKHGMDELGPGPPGIRANEVLHKSHGVSPRSSGDLFFVISASISARPPRRSV